MSLSHLNQDDGPFFNQQAPLVGAAAAPTRGEVDQGVANEENPNPLPRLFQPLTIRGCTIKDRLWVSPMSMYSANHGLASEFHFAHYTQFAARGAGLIMFESTGVMPEGRFTPGCLGLWTDTQADALATIVRRVHRYGTIVGVQLSHSGRLGSSIPLSMYDERPTCRAGTDEGGWPDCIYAPSAIAFSDQFWVPQALSKLQIVDIQQAFADAAVRANHARFDAVDIHAAYGLLLNQFLSPTSNHRTDEYGGSFENRTRMLLETVRRVRRVWPEEKPLFVSLSIIEGVDGGWSVDDTIRLAKLLASEGVDLSEYSSGGNSPNGNVPASPAERIALVSIIKQQAPEVRVGAVGLINSGKQANEILENNHADVVYSGRQFLRNPSFALSAAYELGINIKWAGQYTSAKPSLKYSFF